MGLSLLPSEPLLQKEAVKLEFLVAPKIIIEVYEIIHEPWFMPHFKTIYLLSLKVIYSLF